MRMNVLSLGRVNSVAIATWCIALISLELMSVGKLLIFTCFIPISKKNLSTLSGWFEELSHKPRNFYYLIYPAFVILVC